MSNEIEGANRYEGVIVLDITKADTQSVNNFKKILKELVSEYISTTSIKEPEINYDEKVKGELVILYAYDSRNFEGEENKNIFGEAYTIKSGHDLLKIFVGIARKKTNPNTIELRN
ncbi:hypothetical protein [Exiguobacterium sp. ERU656]|uniref:hypothetical protein n=1 Tax=Exiguobacterium sp. ERU656 TaxID=2751217 RepID=UPI001BECD32A|nr:hypothetical protein [Exiguobacterium sp. ERU656]